MILAAALFGFALLLPAPASAITVCPNMEYSVTFEASSGDMTDLSRETIEVSMERARPCGPSIVIVLRSYSADPQLAVSRAHVVHAALMRQRGAEMVTESRIVSCLVAGEAERVAVTMYLIFPGLPAQPIQTACAPGSVPGG